MVQVAHLKVETMKKWTEESVKSAWIRNGVKNGYISDPNKIIPTLLYLFIGLAAGVLITIGITALLS